MKNKAKNIIVPWMVIIKKYWKFKSLLDFDISHESVRKALKNKGGLYWLNEEIELSGYYGYDAQWVSNEGK